MSAAGAAGTLTVREGRVVEATEGVAALAGRPVGELVGRAHLELLVAEDRPRVADLDARAARGELVPAALEVALLLPGGGRRHVEWHVEREGSAETVHLRDLGEEAARRQLVAALAEIGANLRAERSVEGVHARVREELGRLGAVSALIRAGDGRSQIVWSVAPEAIRREFTALSGSRPEGFAGPMSAFARRVLAEGCAFIDDWATHAPAYLPRANAADARSLVQRAGFSRTAAVRIDAPREEGLYLAIASPVLRSDDLPAVRLFGAQVAAALDAARTIADLSRRNAHLAVLARVAELAGAVDDLPSFFAAASELVRPVAGYVGIAVFVVDDAAGELALVHLDPTAPPGLEPRIRRIPLATPLGEAVRTRVPRATAIPYPGATPAILEALPFRSMAWVPLVARSRGVGALAAAFDADEATALASLELLSSVGAHFAGAVESHALLDGARREVEALSALNEASRAIAGSLELDEVLRQAADAARRVVGAPRAFVVRQDPASGALSVGAAAGVDPAALHGLEGPIPPGSPFEEVLRERRTVCLEDTTTSEAGRVYLRRFGGRALAAVPVLLRGEAEGVLVVDEPAAPRACSAPDLERLTAVADRLALAMENARLFVETRRRAEEMGLLHEVGRSLVQSLELEQVLSGGVQSLARIVDAPAAYLALATPDGAALELRALAGDLAARPGQRAPVRPPTRTIASLVYDRGEPVLVEDARSDPRVTEEMRRLTGARAYLGLPLVVHDRVIGTVVIVETRRPRRFTPPEVERAASIANQLAVAAENARLYEDLRRSYAELARAQQRLVQAERLSALGEMSAVVAHEVRNPLGVIFNSLGSLRRLVRPTGDAKMLLEIIEEEADRLNRIVGDLLDFARPSTPVLRPEDLGRVAEDAVTAAAPPQAGQLELVRELEPELPPVAIDARLVRQAILNVAVNAVQAMPRGGRVTLRARRDGDGVLVEIEDTGTGIPDEVRERIFEPFFTTKASGTGLGLAVVRRIVEGHGGEVRVRSAPGAGTTFTLRFPVDRGPVENGPAMR